MAPKKVKTAVKGNQFKKGLERLQKITTSAALVNRFTHWLKAVEDPVVNTQLNNCFVAIKTMEASRLAAISAMENLGAYTPPANNHAGELKLMFGRQVWIKPKFIATYEQVYSAAQLKELRVYKVVQGRVILLMGAFDQNNIEKMLRTIVPKIHLTATPSTKADK